ncbi:carboxymuconolactone decarboxylase family protein [Litorivicinus sp.]|jgi:4-carboxymuconolactone decarboxylase|nr:carboxymuconolactone decarboxylase family protein [Litorivicinus sp.]MDC1207847.1 carboxymuconolactone decarboxylase family protein [Litorivicinus sp.]MDC1239673.1 carboxymuconolactone decarboxylase family protein [Litorivicinus sp.]MDC1319871.1 carboxymuconolactone decarboxylase family protein [Litorivicinus sp.]|tara:strand:+ start:2642 stop:3019 length:378 start_codon:yes stop_codon:yes gene_type:complete
MSNQQFNDGIEKRRKVMGDDFVDRALAQANDLTMPMQDLVTRVAWDEIWNRDVLSDRDRSLINLGMIAALNRPHEFKGHVRGALNNGLGKEEIRDVCLQVAVYCGFPAGLDSLRNAMEVINEDQV